MRKIRIFTGVIVSALLCWWLAVQVQFELLLSHHQAISILPLAFAAVVVAALVFAETCRLWAATSDLGTRFNSMARMHLIAVLLSNFGLGQAGGDLYRIVALKAFSKNYGQAAFRVAATRVIGLVCVIALGLWGMVELTPFIRLEWRTWAGVVAAGLAGAGLTALVFSARLRAYLAKQWNDLAGAFDQPRLWRVTLLSLLIAGLRCVQFWLLLIAVGVSLTWVQIAAVVALALLVSTLPVSYGGWGVREGTIVWVLLLLDVNYEPALLVALCGRALLVCVAAAGALVYVVERSRLKEDARPTGDLP